MLFSAGVQRPLFRGLPLLQPTENARLASRAVGSQSLPMLRNAPAAARSSPRSGCALSAQRQRKDSRRRPPMQPPYRLECTDLRRLRRRPLRFSRPRGQWVATLCRHCLKCLFLFPLLAILWIPR